MVLRDYLAAVSDERSAGHGSRMLGFLREACAEKGGILIEAEDPAFAADEADGEIRRRRIRSTIKMAPETPASVPWCSRQSM